MLKPILYFWDADLEEWVPARDYKKQKAPKVPYRPSRAADLKATRPVRQVDKDTENPAEP